MAKNYIESSLMGLWVSSYQTLYEACYQEMLSESLLLLWSRFDAAVSWAVVITSSGSAVSALAVWSTTMGKPIWALIAVLAAAAAIGHRVSNASGRMTDQDALRKSFADVRIDLESFRRRVRQQIDRGAGDDGNGGAAGSVAELEKEMTTLESRFKEIYIKTTADILHTEKLRHRVKGELDQLFARKGYTVTLAKGIQ